MDKAEIIFEKLAAPAYIKRFRKGIINMEQAGDIAKRLRLKPRELKPLEPGSESMVSVVTHPKTGLAVQKEMDPLGPYFSKESFQDKIDVDKQLQNTGLLAKHLGTKPNRPVLYQEYIPGKTLRTDRRRDNDIADFVSNTVDKVYKHPTKYITDVHAANIIETKNRQAKLVDFIVSPDSYHRGTDVAPVWSREKKGLVKRRAHNFKLVAGRK